MVIVHDFLHDLEPVLPEFGVRCKPGPFVLFAFFCHVLVIVVVEVSVGGVVAVIGHTLVRAVGIVPLVGAPPGKRSSQMLRHAEGHIVLLRSLLPESADVLVRTHVHGIEAVVLRLKVKEMVVVGCLSHEESCACFVIALHKAFRVEVLGFPQSADVLVAKLGRMAVGS